MERITKIVEKEEIIVYPMVIKNDRPKVHLTYYINCPVNLIDAIIEGWDKIKKEKFYGKS